MKKHKTFVIRELFDIHPTKAYKLTNADLFSVNGTTPVVTNTSDNHGRPNMSELDPTEHDIITFSDTGTKSPDSFFYQEGEFIGYPHVQGMYPYCDNWNRNSLNYLIAILKKKTHGLYDYSTKMQREIILDMSIELPVNDADEIDFEYMDNYIQGIIDKNSATLKDIVDTIVPNNILTPDEKKLLDKVKKGKLELEKVRGDELFVIKGNPQLNKESFIFSDSAEYPYFTRTVFNNGIYDYVEYLDDEHLIKGNAIAVGMMGMRFFYMEHDFYAGQFTKTLYPKMKEFDEDIALFFITLLNKQSEFYLGGLVRDFEKLVNNTEFDVPMKNGEIDFQLIRKIIRIEKKLVTMNLA